MSISDRQLNELAQRLGGDVAARLDVDATATAVLERLRSDSNAVNSGWRRQTPVWGALAAAAAAVLAVGILTGEDQAQLMNSGGLAHAPAELQVLSVEELEEVYDSLSFEAPVSEMAMSSLDDLSVGQLEELLETLMED